MADQNDLGKDNDQEFDDGLELPELGEAPGGVAGKGRTPIQRVSSGFLQGARETIQTRRTQRGVINNLLPPGYEQAYDVGADTLDTAQDLYDTAAEQIKPVKKDLKKIGRKVADVSEGKVPESVTRKLRELSKKDEDRNRSLPSKEQQQEAKIETALTDIFESEQEQASRRDYQQSQRDIAKETTDQVRFEREIQQLDRIRQGIGRIVGYQDDVVSRYQRRSLKLQYQHLHVAKNQFSLFEGFASQVKTQLDAVANNTALPEYVKIQTSEALSRQFLQSALESVEGKVSGFLGQFKDRAQARVKDVSTRFAEGVRGTSEGIDQAQDTPIDGLEVGGSIVGGQATEKGLSKLAKRFGGQVGRIPGVARTGENLGFLASNRGELFRERLNEEQRRSEDPDQEGSKLANRARGMIASFLQELMPNISPEATVGQSAINQAQQAVPFTEFTNRSITEIIPSLLENILHETEMIRTGDDSVEKRTFDPDQGRLSRQSELESSLADRIFPADQVDSMRDRLEQVINNIDPQQQLSENARSALMRQMIEDASKGRGFRPERLTSERGLSQVDNEEDRGQIQQVVSDRFLDQQGQFRSDDDQAVAARSQASREFQGARDQIPNYQETIRQLLPIYGPEVLQNAGLISSTKDTGESRINTESIMDRLSGRSTTTSPAQSSTTSQGVSFDHLTMDTSRAEKQDSSDQQDTIAGSGFVQSQIDQLLQAIRSINVQDKIDTANEWLNKIHDLLAGGGGPSPSGPPTPSSSPDDSSPRHSYIPTISSRVKDYANFVTGQAQRGASATRQGLQSAGEQIATKARSAQNQVQQRFSESQENVSGFYNQLHDQASNRFEQVRDQGSSLIDQLSDRLSQSSTFAQAVGGGGGSFHASLQQPSVQPVNGAMQTIDSDQTSANEDQPENRGQRLQDRLSSTLDRLRQTLMRENQDQGQMGSESSISDEQIEQQRQNRHQELIDRIRQSTEELKEVIAFTSAMSDTQLGESASDSQQGVTMIKRIGRGVGSGLGGIASFYGNTFRAVGRFTAGAGRLGGGVLGGIGQRAKSLIGGRSQPSTEEDSTDQSNIQDIYMVGYNQPVLRARDLRQGRYFSQESGKTIYTLDDIDSPVVDTDGNIILTGEEIAGDNLYTKDGTPLKDLLSGGAGMFRSLTDFATAPTRGVFNLIRGGIGKMKSLFGGPRDVYVRGESRPRLLAVVLRNGGYFSQASQTRLYSIDDVDGPVVDREGNVVLSLEDMTRGLVDSRGKLIEGLADKAKRWMKGGLSIVGSMARTTMRAGTQAMGGIAEKLGVKSRQSDTQQSDSSMAAGSDQDEGQGLASLFKTANGYSRDQLSILQDIKKLITDRIPPPPEDVREGGWRDLFGERKQKEEADQQRQQGQDSIFADKEKGLLGGGGGLLASLFGLGGGEGDSFIGDAAAGATGGAAADRLGRRGKTPETPKKGGFFRSLKRGGGKFLRGAKGLLKGGAALGAGLLSTKALAAAGTGLATAGSYAASGLGAAAAGIGSVLSAPVVLGVGATLAVGAAAYFGYKYLSRDRSGPLDHLRVAQYGFDINNDDHEDAIKRCAAMEQYLKPYVEIDDKNDAKLSNEVDVEGLLEEIGISVEDNQSIEQWLAWFRARFLPVYLTHVLSMHRLAGKKDLSNVAQSLKPEQQIEHLKAVQFGEGKQPYGYQQSPFSKPMRLLGPDAVDTIYRQTKDKVFESVDQQVKDPISTGGVRPGMRQRQEQQRNRVEQAKREFDQSKSSRNQSTSSMNLNVPSDRDLLTQGSLAPLSLDRSMVQLDQHKRSDLSSDTTASTASKSPDPNQQDFATTTLPATVDQSQNDQERAVQKIKDRETRIVEQTSVQTAEKSTQMVRRLDDVVEVLQASHQTQRDMDQSLKDIRQLLKENYEAERERLLMERANDQNSELTAEEQKMINKLRDKRRNRSSSSSNYDITVTMKRT